MVGLHPPIPAPEHERSCHEEIAHMRPRITVITIGVDDLESSLGFYRDGLGLKTEGISAQSSSMEPWLSLIYKQV